MAQTLPDLTPKKLFSKSLHKLKYIYIYMLSEKGSFIIIFTYCCFEERCKTLKILIRYIIDLAVLFYDKICFTINQELFEWYIHTNMKMSKFLYIKKCVSQLSHFGPIYFFLHFNVFLKKKKKFLPFICLFHNHNPSSSEPIQYVPAKFIVDLP